MMRANDDDIECRQCGNATCSPPPGREDWQGLCPKCVIRNDALPYIPDSRVRDLVETFIDHNCIELVDSAQVAGILVIGQGDQDQVMDQVASAVKTAISNLIHSKDARKKLREMLDLADEHDVDEGGGKMQKPKVRNDPRTG